MRLRFGYSVLAVALGCCSAAWADQPGATEKNDAKAKAKAKATTTQPSGGARNAAGAGAQASATLPGIGTRFSLTSDYDLTRSGAADAGVVRRLTSGTQVTILEHGSGYVRVRTDQGEGWLPVGAFATTTNRMAASDRARIGGEGHGDDKATPPGMTATNRMEGSARSGGEGHGDDRTTQGSTGVRASSGVALSSSLDLSEQPGEGGMTSGRLDAGTHVTIVERRGEWSLVRDASGTQGWVRSSAIGGQPDAPSTSSAANVRVAGALYRDPMTTSTSVTQLTAGAPVTIVSEDGDWLRVRSGGSEGWVQRSNVDIVADSSRGKGTGLTGEVTVTTDQSLGAHPGEGASQAGRVTAGSRVTILEQRGTWVRVRDASGREGWLRSDAIANAATAGRLPGGDASSAPDRMPPFANGITVELTADGKLLSQPMASATAAGAVRLGAEVTVLESRGDYVRVRTSTGTEGWVLRSQLRTAQSKEPFASAKND